MIGKQDVLDRAGEWQLRAEVVEKDYVLGWLLAAIARHPETSSHWVFKGGTSLKKCYFETYRFSEDLDFSLLEPARYSEEDLGTILLEVTIEAASMSGLRFPRDAISVRSRRDKLGRPTFEGKVGYEGPLAYPGVRRILFDLTQHEPVLDGVHHQGVHHPYPDGLPEETRVPAYSLDELFAEKTRALFERSRPRDLYDVVYIQENRADTLNLPHARDLFQGKCRAKELAPPSAADLIAVVNGRRSRRTAGHADCSGQSWTDLDGAWLRQCVAGRGGRPDQGSRARRSLASSSRASVRSSSGAPAASRIEIARRRSGSASWKRPWFS